MGLRPAVPVASDIPIAVMADDIEKRFRQQHAEVFRPGVTPKAWTDLGVAYLRFSDGLDRSLRCWPNGY
jgi:hypothetical protein